VTAQIFLASFFGCALAFAFAIVIVWQLGSRAFRKIMQGHEAQAMASMAQMGAAEMKAEAEALMQRRVPVPVAMVTVTCRDCNLGKLVPDHEIAGEILAESGWKIAPPNRLLCRACAGDYGDAIDPRTWRAS